MADNLSPNDRRKCMRGVRAKDTGAELIVRRALHRSGLRYRLHRKDIPGKPDLAFVSLKAAVFVHGCFWHGHNCKRGNLPAERRAFWEAKQNRNRARDVEVQRQLREKGWRCAVIWECALRGPARQSLNELTNALNQWLKSESGEVSFEGVAAESGYGRRGR